MKSRQSKSMRRLGVLAVASACLGAAAFAPAFAQSSDDTRFRLDQALDRSAAQKESQRLDAVPEDLSGTTTIDIDGQTYSVANTIDDVGRALYISIMRRQWDNARRFLAAYREFPDQDPMLVHYAEGSLARQDGHYSEAEAEFRALLALQPDFLPGQLELGRVLFEDQLDREAAAQFRSVLTSLSADHQADGVRRSVELYLQALNDRRKWHGSVAAGLTYNTNLNQSSASYMCLFAMDDGTCLLDRKMPDAVKAYGTDVEATLTRRFAIRRHTGLVARALFYGSAYRGEGAYNQSTLSTQLGLDYRSARVTYSLSPTYDVATYGSDRLYDAWGVKADWNYNLSPATGVKLEGRHRTLTYHLPGYDAYNGDLTDVSTTVWHTLSSQWTLFGGPDYSRKQTDDPVNAYRQAGIRLGATRTVSRFGNLFVLTSFRESRYDAYSELLEARRRDRERNLIAVLTGDRWAVQGFVPSLTVQYNRVESNIAWLYAYDRTSVSLKLQKVF